MSRNFLITLAFVGTAATVAAQTAPNNAYFQDAVVVGSTNSISITHVPAVVGTKVVYWDLTIPFHVDSYGNIVADPLDALKSPYLISSAFKPGNYVGPSTILSGSAKIVLQGPGVWNGIYSEWTISAGAGANGCTYPSTAAFYVGALAGNPLYARLKNAGIASTAWSYGIGSGPYCYTKWPPNGIIGVSQVGNTITIASFTAGNTGDQSTPVDQLTFTLY